MIAVLALMVQLQAADSLPQVTLRDALQMAARVDPGYVEARGRIGDAAWARRSAFSTFILPSIDVSSSFTKFSSEFFNIGTGQLATQIVDARLEASYDLFRGGAKYFELKQAGAEVDAAEANEVDAWFATALATESDYYQVLAERELTRVARERVRRAEEQFQVARARVLSGAAVSTDSLQLSLELTRARVDLLRQEAALRVSRFQLGRRIGADGPVDAVALDTAPAPPLPLSEEEAVAGATASAPRYLAAEAAARAATAQARAVWGSFLPQVVLFGQYTAFDDSFFPSGTTRSLGGVAVSFPIWNNGQREVRLSRAQTDRAVAEARLLDAELRIRRDVVEAYQAYTTARAAAELARDGVAVARENLRVQAERYRGGATTIIDLITAQVDLSEADAGLVQARHAARLALAGLEAVLGRRLFPQREGR